MKGQLLQTLQSTGSSFSLSCNRPVGLARADRPKSCSGLLSPLLLFVGLLLQQSLPAAGPAIPLSPEAIKSLTEAVSDEIWLVVNPSSTNTILHDAPIVGSTNITELEEILHLYADSTGRIVLWPRNLSVAGLDFSADKSLNRREATLALDAFFARRGIGMLEVGEKWVSAMSSAGCQTSADSTRQTNYVVHVQHVSYVKPSHLVPVLQPFCSGVANAVLPIDSEQTLVLRDFPQNVQKMRDVIREVDVAIPIEYMSEVIPVKYAKASEIAAALNKSALLEPKAKHRPALENIVEFGQHKIIADERTNSLLVYAGLEDMKQIKEIISHLDLVAAQILIEAVIIEVNRDNDLNFLAIDNEKVPWMTNFVSSLPANATPSANSAPEAGFYRLAAITNDLDSFVMTLATNNSAKILQRPRIQTSDGEPAQLFVGEARRLTNEVYSGGAICGWASIQKANLGVTLDLTPSLLSGQTLALDIHQTIEEVDGSVFIENVGDVPITRRSERSAKITVRDGDLVLLDSSIERDNTPKELIVLIHPRILPLPEVAQLSKAEKDKMPGVRRAETEIQTEEANRLKQLEKNLERDPGLSRE
jgi:hypothetical protein